MTTRPVVLITGANSGIGGGISKVLSRAGYRVFGTYFSQEERAQALQAEITGEGGEIDLRWVDLADSALNLSQLIATVLERFGNLHALVNCAAEVSTIRFGDLTPSDFSRIMRLNLEAPLFISQAAFHAHQQNACQLTAIVNVSSVSDRFVWHGPAYEASKAGLSMITRSIGFELAKLDIRVNAVAPGTVEVERVLMDPSWRREVFKDIVPMGRPGDPEDIAEVVRFLLSDAARYITGQVIYVDGGLSLRL